MREILIINISSNYLFIQSEAVLLHGEYNADVISPSTYILETFWTLLS
jgi:hypothetical protein